MSEQDVPMTLEQEHPFRVEHIFFQTIKLERPSKFDKDSPYELGVEISFGIDEQKKIYSISLKVHSPEKENVQLATEIITVGTFKYLGDGAPNSEQLVNFVNKHLLISITSRLIQLVATLTNQMGIPAIWLPTPFAYGFDSGMMETILKEDSQILE